MATRYNPIVPTGNNRYSPIVENPVEAKPPQIVIPQYAKPDPNSTLKISQAPKKGFLENVSDNVTEFLEPVAKIFEGTPIGRKPVKETANEQSLINTATALEKQRRQGKVLTPEEQAMLKAGSDISASRLTEQAGAFIGSADMVGGKLKNVIINTKTTARAKEVLKGLGLADDVTELLAPKVVRANNKNTAQAVIQEMDDIITGKVKPSSSKPPIKQIAAQTETPKYKSAEELVTKDILSQGKTGIIPGEDIAYTPRNSYSGSRGVIPHDLVPYGKYLYHETSPKNAQQILEYLGSAGPLSPQTIHLANTPELALGQGGNKGIKIVFDSSQVRGVQPLNKKPNASFLEKQGITDEIVGKDFNSKSVIGFEAPPDFEIRAISRNPDGSPAISEGMMKRLGISKNPIILPNGNKFYIKSDLIDSYNQPGKSKSIFPSQKKNQVVDGVDESAYNLPAKGDSPLEAIDNTVNLPPEVPVEPVQKVVTQDIRTPMSERVRAIDYLRTPWKVFERMGIRPQYNELLTGYENYVKELPQNIDKITAWSKQVPKESNERIFRALDGEAIQLSPEESRVAGEIKTWLSQWADRLGMKPDERISDYITHIFPFGKGGEIPEEIAFLINKKIPGSVYNPFLLQRQGAEGYIKDTWKALDAYVKRATRKVNMDPALAELKAATAKMTDTSQLDYLNRYIGAINLRPTELDTLLDNYIKDKTGYLFGARPTAAITRFLRQTIARAKIGGSITSFAKNLTQGVNTFSELGPVYTAKGYLDLVKYGGKELKENGVLVAPMIEDRTYSAVKKMAEKFDNALFINMTASELVNRGAAYYGAKAKFLKGKVTSKEFKQAFGKSMPKGYTPTVEDAVTYGKFISGKTQFLFGPLDTPVGLNSDVAKTAAQFQTFGIKQTEFLAHMIGAREYSKLLRYIISSMVMFAWVGSAFGMKWDDSWKTFKFGAPPAYTFAKDLFGAILGTKDQYGNVPSGEQRLRNAGESLFTNLVPAGAQIKRSVEGFQAVNEGASRSKPTKANPKGIFQYKVKKTPINYVRGTAFGKSNLDEAQDYYNKPEKKSGGTSSSRYSPQ